MGDRPKEWYHSRGEEVCRDFGVGPDGLMETEAARRLARTGENALRERPSKRVWQVFAGQFEDLLVVILLAAALFSALSGDVESAAVIVAVLVMNAALGTVQHEKARRSLQSLRAMSAPTARVHRVGIIREIPARQLVPGDLVFLETGALVPADGRILECCFLQVDESALTGESMGVEKTAAVLPGEGRIPAADQSNMIFSGSRVRAGRGRMVVTATGMDTELGRIAVLMNETGEKETPLQVSLDTFSGKLAFLILLICVLVFGLSLYRQMPLLEALMFAVALAVAAIPEALGSIVTIVQAMGTRQMAKEHAIIRDLKAVESLGCVSVICSDKTGTLTQNQMQVQIVYTDGQELLPEEVDWRQPVCRMLLAGAVLCSNASACGAGTPQLRGDPTEDALIALARAAGAEVEEMRAKMPRMREIPFDSNRKRMCTVNLVEGRELLFVKGAPDVLLERVAYVLTSGGVRALDSAVRKRLERENAGLAARGFRVIGIAYREMEARYAASESGYKVHEATDDIETDLIFLGFAAMSDPPRPESCPAIFAARRAGIRTVMITGDHPVTALAVAEKIGLFETGGSLTSRMAVTGAELDAMDDRKLEEILAETVVYARVSPEHKIRIVEAWQRSGHIVAMTGDGVNDAPALKKADIGVAMGLSGTDVSRDAASMVLADDNFATIIKAVSNGRNVYRNIRNAIQFLLSGNMAGILCVLSTSLLALPLPFAPVHLLFINLLTDSLPAIAIGMEPQEEELLHRPPRDPSEGILTRRFTLKILIQGIGIACGAMLPYFIGLRTGDAGVARTMAFAALTLARLLHGFNCRSGHSIRRLGIGSNPWSVLAFAAGVLLLGAALLVPELHALLAVADLDRMQITVVVIGALLPTVFIQAWKELRDSVKSA
ncbi:MAG: cation-translocating P-type ATPase [Clostridiales bacterium]|nr:cation-translocating P-type ATPase [Clostridiales bacterium]